MLIMTGKIMMIESKQITLNGETFQKVILVIVKQMKGVKRNICFESYGKVAKEILTFTSGERIKVFFTIDSVCNKDNWFHKLKAVEVEKSIKFPKINNTINEINFTDNDTIKESIE